MSCIGFSALSSFMVGSTLLTLVFADSGYVAPAGPGFGLSGFSFSGLIAFP